MLSGRFREPSVLGLLLLEETEKPGISEWFRIFSPLAADRNADEVIINEKVCPFGWVEREPRQWANFSLRLAKILSLLF